MDTKHLVRAFIFSVINLKHIDSQGTDCFEYTNGFPSYTGTTNVTDTGKTCQRWDSQYPHLHVLYVLTSEHRNYCRSPDRKYKKIWCYTKDQTTRWEDSAIPECERSTETVIVKSTQATSATSKSIKDSTTAEFMNMITSDTSQGTISQSTLYTSRELSSTTSENPKTDISNVLTENSTQATPANGEWSMLDEWKFCEVNCVREDTIDGKQRRWRTCKGSKCSGENMEERSCSEPGICKGMRPRKLLCKCPKRLIKTKWHFLDGKKITSFDVKKMVLADCNKNIKSEISVDKKTLSKEVRKKKSSVNKRKSAQSIGWGCIVFLIFPMVLLIAIDLLNCCIHFRARFGRRKRNRTTASHVIQDHGDPLQENVDITEEFYASRRDNNFDPHQMTRETYQRRRENQHSRMELMQYI